MTATLAYLAALVSTAAFIILWFWYVRVELRTKKNIIISAELQHDACLKKLEEARFDSEIKAAKSVLSRSEDIYHQSIVIYNQTLGKPWNNIPGYLMGFKEFNDEKQERNML